MSEKEKNPQSVKFSLKMKLSFAMIMITILTVAGMAVYFIDNQSKILLGDTMDLAEREAEHLSNTTKEALSTDDELTIISALDNLRKLPSIAYAYVLDPSGAVLQSTFLEAVGTKLEDQLTKKALEFEHPSGVPVKPRRQTSPDTKDKKGRT